MRISINTHWTPKLLVIGIAIIAFLGCDTSSNVEPRFNNVFLKFYGGGSDFEAVDFQLDTDLGFIIVGNSISTNDPDSSAIIMIKTDNIGNEQERAILDFSVTKAKASSIRIIPEGYLVGGTLGEGEQSQIVVAKYSSVGVLISSTTLSRPDSTIFTNLTCSQVNFDDKGGAGDGYLVAGSIDEIGSSTVQTYTQRLFDDLTVDPSWSGNIISGPSNVESSLEFQSPGISLLPTVNTNDYFAFGTTSEPEEANTYDDDTFFSRRLFRTGSPEREENYGVDEQDEEEMSDVVRYSSSEYLMVGTNETSSPNSVVVSSARFNSQTRILSETFSFNYTETTNDGTPLVLKGNSGNVRRVGAGILITGSALLTADISDIFLASVDQSTGQKQWFVNFGFDGLSEGVKVFQNDDGSIMLLATVSTFGSESTRSRIALIKTNGQGELK